MSTRAPITELGTHEVTNQPPVLADYNPFDADPALKEALRREGAGGGVRCVLCIASRRRLGADLRDAADCRRLR